MRCPVCGAEVIRVGDTYVCRNGHVIDDSMPALGTGTRATAGDERGWFTPVYLTAPRVGSMPVSRSMLALQLENVAVNVEARRVFIGMLSALDIELPDGLAEYAVSIIDRAVELMRRRNVKRCVPGNAAAAAVYAVLAAMGRPEPVNELVERLRAHRFCVSRRTVSMLVHSLGIRVRYVDFLRSYIARIARVLRHSYNLPPAVEALAARIGEAAATHSRIPSCMAAAAVYLAARILCCEVPQRDVAHAAGRTEACIRLALNEILERVEITVGV